MLVLSKTIVSGRAMEPSVVPGSFHLICPIIERGIELRVLGDPTHFGLLA